MLPKYRVAGYFRLGVAGIIFGTLLPGQTSSTITLATSPNPSVYGQPVTLTAKVTAGASGRVTFYDRVTILGVATLFDTQASVTTVMLPLGIRGLWAYYQGDGTYAPSTSASAPQTVAALSSPALHRPANYSFPFAGGAFAVADVNQDGKMDLVVPTVSGVAVYLGNGDGTFQTVPLGRPVQGQPQSVVVADFNGDGLTDVATSNGLGSAAVLLQNIDGSINGPLYSWAGSSPAEAAVADFNGDGIADLAISQINSPDVAILLGKGDGTFQNPLFVPAGDATLPPVVADVNRDGNADLVVSLNGGGVGVILGNGNGTFQPVKTLTLTGVPVAAADLNEDGIVDIVSIDSDNHQINVALGNGDGTFGPPLSYGIPHDAGTPIVADVNGDGKLDLVIPGYFWGLSYQHLALALGNGDGTFGSATLYPLPDGPFAPGFVAAGDFNSDGKTDLATPGPNGGFSILFGGLTCAVTGEASPGPADVKLILQEALGAALPNDDINQDGLINVVDVQAVVNATVGLACLY